MEQKDFMSIAVDEAFKGLDKNHGGPFGAVIVKNGKIVSKGHNEVIRRHDPTCHAEMMAIRAASRKLKRFDLSDCEIYSSCEPCPMCFAAIHWAKIKKLYYGSTRTDAKEIGFDDEFIYDVIKGTSTKNQVEVINIFREICLKPFKSWTEKADKTPY